MPHHGEILDARKAKTDAHAKVRAAIKMLGPALGDLCVEMTPRQRYSPGEVPEEEVARIAGVMRGWDDALLAQIGQFAVSAVVDETQAMVEEMVSTRN